MMRDRPPLQRKFFLHFFCFLDPFKVNPTSHEYTATDPTESLGNFTVPFFKPGGLPHPKNSQLRTVKNAAYKKLYVHRFNV